MQEIFLPENADKSLSPLLLNQYRMDGLSGRARQYWYDQRRSLKIYDPRGVHVTTGTSHTWCINTGADMELLSTFLLNLRTLRNRYAADAAFLSLYRLASAARCFQRKRQI